MVVSASLRQGNFAPSRLLPDKVSLDHWKFVLGIPYQEVVTFAIFPLPVTGDLRRANLRDFVPNYDPGPIDYRIVCTDAIRRGRHSISQGIRSYDIFELYSPPAISERLAVGTA